MAQGAKVPGNEIARERKGPGAKAPGSDLTRERIDQGPIGRFSPGIEWARERKGSVPWCTTLSIVLTRLPVYLGLFTVTAS